MGPQIEGRPIGYVTYLSLCDDNAIAEVSSVASGSL